MTQMDIASNLWPLVHNDTGHGGYYNDLDMLQVGQGDMNPAKDGTNAMSRARSHYTQHLMMKSTLLISTVLSELPAEVIKMFTNAEAVSGTHAQEQAIAIYEAEVSTCLFMPAWVRSLCTKTHGECKRGVSRPSDRL